MTLVRSLELHGPLSTAECGPGVPSTVASQAAPHPHPGTEQTVQVEENDQERPLNLLSATWDVLHHPPAPPKKNPLRICLTVSQSTVSLIPAVSKSFAFYRILLHLYNWIGILCFCNYCWFPWFMKIFVLASYFERLTFQYWANTCPMLLGQHRKFLWASMITHLCQLVNL